MDLNSWREHRAFVSAEAQSELLRLRGEISGCPLGSLKNGSVIKRLKFPPQPLEV